MTKYIGNLPAEVSSFVDRRQEKAEIKRLLSTSRLVTVTGVGGVGKTRTTLRVAAEVRKGFPGGAWLVELSALRDGALLSEVVAEGLGLRNQTRRCSAAMLAEHLAPQRLLLVLDGCEHLVDPCAALVHTLLRAAAGLRVLVTSRQALGVTGEHLFPLAPLAVPPKGRWKPGAAPYPGVELFLERAQAVERRFTLSEENRAAVGRLCHRLDGIPLAIELAAGRLRALSVQEIVSHLDDRFELLAGRSRGQPARHETLRTAIDWSYQLCSPGERLLWALASVFPGDFDLVAARAVCTDEELPADDVLDLVTGLVDKSILLYDDHPLGARYRLLDTLREYGQWRLRPWRDEVLQRRRHRDYYLRLAKRCGAEWCGPEQISWYRRIRTEQLNLWTALEFCLADPPDIQKALEGAIALVPLSISCGGMREGRHYLDRALARDPAPGPVLTHALVMCAWLAMAQGDLDAAEHRLAECRGHAEPDDIVTAGWIAFVAAGTALFRGDPATALTLGRQSAELHANGGDPALGLVEALTVQSMALALCNEFDQAITYAEQLRALCDRYGELWMRSYADYLHAMAELGRGKVDAAVLHAGNALRVKRQLRDGLGIALLLDMLAVVDVLRGDAERAARLLGSAGRLWPIVGAPQLNSPELAATRRECERQVRDRLGDDAYKAAVQAGADLDLSSAVAYALDEPPPAGARKPASWAPLTRREREIAELVAHGLTNQQIADRLVISKRTADSHVQHTLTKLGFTRRAQIAAWVAARRK